MALDYDEALAAAKNATSLDALYDAFGISGASLEGWYVDIMWTALRGDDPDKDDQHALDLAVAVSQVAILAMRTVERKKFTSDLRQQLVQQLKELR